MIFRKSYSLTDYYTNYTNIFKLMSREKRHEVSSKLYNKQIQEIQWTRTVIHEQWSSELKEMSQVLTTKNINRIEKVSKIIPISEIAMSELLFVCIIYCWFNDDPFHQLYLCKTTRGYLAQRFQCPYQELVGIFLNWSTSKNCSRICSNHRLNHYC